MQVLRSRLFIALIAALAVACSGAPSPTQAPGGGGNTTGPLATPGGQVATPPGGGTGGGTGQIHIEIGGPVQMTVDAPFFSVGSRFGGPAGVALNFTTPGSEAIASVTGINETWVVSYASAELAANSQSCQLSNWNIGATSGAGSFDCRDGFATKTDGTFLSGITMKGSFQAGQ
jgi:hypothetical protein